ncbi:RNA polymerase II mediator complex subunit [Ascochyta clinopodiicola]|nr:RNA polymerase II mediator complex subunit [Ascochyta clinopodiicola]
MTSRPGPGIHEQSRGSGVPSRSHSHSQSQSQAPAQARRRPSKPLNTALPQPIDPALDDVRPPAHHGAADSARPLPRGRPQLFYGTAPHDPYELPVHPAFPYQPTTPLPLPPRPGSVHLRDASTHRRIAPGGTGVKEHPSVQPPELITPPVHFPGGEAADVSPWTGNNPKDTLTEALVKAGISNKPQIMNETNTARPSLWSNLKNKSGLSTLSTLFVAVLEKRQQTGRLQEPNTFKPPPRLTLRDSTREQWLHDLANPAVGVRRLSRTIPHGLTGKVLLEQCLNKNIPLMRALWLAKCVGINELRSHKRKGQAGTVTWVRGWTSSVEQFLDGIISSMGTGEWKPRITYSVKLATHLYKECLLDVDHFLDWMLHNLEACPSERLFVWLTLLSVPHYWNDIISCPGRYMQWLIATGSIAQDLDLSLPAAWPVRLITEIPISGLPDQIRTLRATLLRGTAYSADWEDQCLDHAKLSISHQMPILCGMGYSTLDHPKIDIGKLGSTVRIELGIWLRQQVAWFAELNEHVPTKDPAVEETATVSLITPHDFDIVRSYLEQFDDLSLLADVVNIVTSSLDPSVLASATDTMHYHLKAFRAIGAFDSLFGRVVTRYASIRTIRFPERELLLSLTNLTRTLQLDGQLLQLLNYDLSRLDQKNSMAACSPASDNMGEVMYNISSNAEDEIERILSSGNSMDQQVMARVLRKITGSLQDCVSKGILQSDHYSNWFYRLRSFDDSTFDVVLNEWTNLCLVNHQVEVLFLALPTLVGSGCMPLSGFLESLRAYVAKTATGQPEIAFRVASEGLYSLLPSDVLARTWSSSDGYRFRLEQRKLCYEADARVLQFISELVELGTALPVQKVGQQLSSLVSSSSVLNILKHYTLVDTTHLSKFRTGGSNGDLKRQYLKVPFGLLLDPHGNLDISAKIPEQQVLEIFDIASELSMPFCRSMVQQIFESDSVSTECSADGLSAALLSAIKSALEKDQLSALELLATLDSALTIKIRQQAEREIIDASSFLTTSPLEPQSFSSLSPALVQKYLTIIDLTTGEGSDASEPSTISMALIERIKGVAQALTTLGGVGKLHTHTDHLTVSDLYTWTNALFRVLISHKTSLVGNATHQHQTALMVALKSLFVHPLLELYPHIAEHIFDVTVVLSDLLSDDVRIQLARAESTAPADDPRFSFIVGSATPIDGWLVLTKPVNPPQPAQSFAPSQPQTPVNIPSQYQSPQMSNSAASSPQQRYFNSQQQRQQQMQAQQLRSYPQYPQHTHPQNKMLPAQLQRNPSNPTPLQQMQHMQHMQSLAQQRATQPSPVQSQRPASMASGLGAANGKLPAAQAKEVRQFPYVQPRWEILAESSGNPNANETAINLSLFGARRA